MTETTTSGCPQCPWTGDVAETHDQTHRYYTHVVIEDGELLSGRTCSERYRPTRSVFKRVLGEVFNDD